MATSTDYSTLAVRETATEAKIGEEWVLGGTCIKHTDGTVTYSSQTLQVATIKQRQLIVEKRGYTSRPTVPAGSTSTATSGKFTYEQKKVDYEASRINEAGFWRLTKTVTIQALYLNNTKVNGKTDFDTGDDSIS